MLTSAKSTKILKHKQVFYSTTLTFDIKEVFQFYFDILKIKRIIFNINSSFYIGINI